MNSIKVNSEGINKATKGRVNIAKQYMNSYVTCKLSNYGSLFPHTHVAWQELRKNCLNLLAWLHVL